MLDTIHIQNAFKWYDSVYIANLNNTPLSVSEPDFGEHRKMIAYYLQNKDYFDIIRG
ncbi:MAG: hypothetical protein GX639_11030 [Fibrobacter sp.]|nr:hypothetical protein [Fibrobacter sp.]